VIDPGRHALVTGAGSGIGAAIAMALAAGGARVTLLGRNEERLQSVAAQIARPNAAQVVTADVCDAAAIERAFAQARQQFGALHTLVNNAGQASSAPLEQTDELLWRRMLDVNLTSAWLCIRAALPDLQKTGGRIVNVASTAGLRGYPYVSAYVAAKHGLVGLTRALALELARKKITVNAVCPGFTDTALVRDAIDNIVNKTGRTTEQARAALVAGNPQHRLMTPQEVAHTVVWLCADESFGITGQSIAVAGGEVMA
jgi:NAD(P)-dependent dehydrogenase (short-subunit alcohol dehydrogenase family)